MSKRPASAVIFDSPGGPGSKTELAVIVGPEEYDEFGRKCLIAVWSAAPPELVPVAFLQEHYRNALRCYNQRPRPWASLQWPVHFPAGLAAGEPEAPSPCVPEPVQQPPRKQPRLREDADVKTAARTAPMRVKSEPGDCDRGGDVEKYDADYALGFLGEANLHEIFQVLRSDFHRLRNVVYASRVTSDQLTQDLRVARSQLDAARHAKEGALDEVGRAMRVKRELMDERNAAVRDLRNVEKELAGVKAAAARDREEAARRIGELEKGNHVRDAWVKYYADRSAHLARLLNRPEMATNGPPQGPAPGHAQGHGPAATSAQHFLQSALAAPEPARGGGMFPTGPPQPSFNGQ